MSELAEQRIFEERILAQDPEIIDIIPYTLHSDLVCPIGDDINPDGTIMVPACICARHKTAAGMRYFFTYLASEKRKSQIAARNQFIPNIRARLARVATVIMSAIYKN
jgi:hypothetical protein